MGESKDITSVSCARVGHSPSATFLAGFTAGLILAWVNCRFPGTTDMAEPRASSGEPRMTQLPHLPRDFGATQHWRPPDGSRPSIDESGKPTQRAFAKLPGAKFAKAYCFTCGGNHAVLPIHSNHSGMSSTCANMGAAIDR